MSFFARLVGKKQPDGDDSNANKDKQSQQQQPMQKQQGESVAEENAAAQSTVAPRAIGGLPRINVAAGQSDAAAAAQSAVSTSAASSSIAAAVPSNVGGASNLPLSAASAPGAPGPGSAAAAAAAPPMPNMSSCCPAEKWRYESCFQKWYSAEYLTGKSTDLSACQPMFDTYRSCVISYYEKNEPEFLLQAGTTSDHLLVEGGSQAFGTKYPNLDKDKKKDGK